MGIKDLTVFLKEHAPESISKGNLSQFAKDKNVKMRAAIDTSLFLYKYNWTVTILSLVFEQIELLINNIEPICIWWFTIRKTRYIQSKKKKRIINQK